MSLLQVVILAVVQGLAELLPVSSSAHVVVAEKLLGLSGDRWEAFTIVIQFGAILAVVVAYWKKFWDVLVGLPRDRRYRNRLLRSSDGDCPRRDPCRTWPA